MSDAAPQTSPETPKRGPSSLAGAILARTVLVLGSIVVTLLIVEIVVIIVWDEPTGPFAGDEIYPTNPRGYFDVDDEGRFVIDSDRRRHRCDDEPTKDDILFVGDSFTWGQGVRVEDTLSSLIRDASASDRAYRVRNCARSGNDSEQIIASLERAASQDPALMVYPLVLNDACGRDDVGRLSHVVANDAAGQPNLVDDGMWVRTHTREAFLEQRRQALGPWRFLLQSTAFRWIHTRMTLADIAKATETVYRTCWEDTPLLQSVFDRLVAAAGDPDRLLVVIWPMFVSLDNYPFEDAHRVVRENFERRGVRVVDLLDTFAGDDAEDLIVHPLDRHPNEVAHRRAVVPVLSAIRAMLAR